MPLWKVASLNHPETFKGHDIAEFLNVRSGRVVYLDLPDNICFVNIRIDAPPVAYYLSIPNSKQSTSIVEFFLQTNVIFLHRIHRFQIDRKSNTKNVYFQNLKNHEQHWCSASRLQYTHIYTANTFLYDKFSPRITWQPHKRAVKRHDDVSMAKVTAMKYVTRAKTYFFGFNGRPDAGGKRELISLERADGEGYLFHSRK